ncbi:DUF4232 domain-containing protein [Kitasatospora phosalacinea]|uniref:DUF4232 domain-containing protein n=1 Tax=Kitasatospora phosalacinea TaxID=2065 RepID=A0A9W6UQL9_9ACTN|nr:DUF4232 domain-containing protein [Kitasatospora phosalacinea]GLW55695.1 hypothetical protein Kpho01_37060 [Kitasatospora phosalacinea]
MRARTLALTTLAVAAALSLTACQDDGTDTAQGAPSTAATAAKSAAAAPSTAAPASPAAPAGTGGTTGGTTAAPAGTGKAAKCRTADLTVTAVDATITGDAEGTVAVELKNHSGKDCTIAGYAGVDLQAAEGTLSAERSGEPVVSAVLKNGKSTYFGVSYPVNTTGGTGVRITHLVVTPPDETHSVTLPWPGGSLPVTDGSGAPVKIGPVGSAGQGE